MWQNTESFQEKRLHNNLQHLQYFTIAVFVILILRLFFISIIKGSYFQKISEDNRIQIFTLPAPRGIIYDRKGKVLVDNRLSFSVLLSPINLKREILEKTIVRLNGVLESVNDYKPGMTGNVCLAEDVEPEKIFYLSEQKHNFPGMRIQVRPKRHYPYGAFAAHLIGYLGQISKRELEDPVHVGYKKRDIIGKTGLEKIYDRFLRGRDGNEQIEVDVNGKPLRMLSHQDSWMGDHLILTVDKNIQDTCEAVLRGKKGAICVLNPKNGEVLAMVSKPDFDPNIFIENTSPLQYRKLFNDPELPMFNRVIQSQQSPGSVFKIITAISALEEGAVDLETTYNCHGSFLLGRGRRSREFKCWKEGGHGRMEIIDAIAHSCDVYFYQAGLKTGVDSISEYAALFGLSALSGFCMPSEERGLIPSARWKREKTGECWYPGDTVNMSIGQGYVLVTPIQMANLASFVAGRGVLYEPFTVRRIIDTEGNIIRTFRPKVKKRVKLKQQTWDIIQRGMREAVTSGTCRGVNFRNLAVAGKTGTTQNPHGDDHAWFICYAPVEDPQVAMSVYVEHGGHGSSAAVPLARKILENMFNLKEEEIVEIFEIED